MQVHILCDPSKEELGQKLEKLRPDILMLHGERDCERDEIGSLVVRDGKVISSECLSPYLSAKIPQLLCLTIEPPILPDLAGSPCRNILFPLLLHSQVYVPRSPFLWERKCRQSSSLSVFQLHGLLVPWFLY